jgi:ribosomal protein S27AE
VPVLEFDKSKNSPLPALTDHYDKPDVEDVPVLCDKCGSEMSEDLDGLPCPKCGKGKFKESGRFMS